MSLELRMPFHEAQAVADELVMSLEPHVERGQLRPEIALDPTGEPLILVCGSLRRYAGLPPDRRRRKTVGDIDIVCIPKSSLRNVWLLPYARARQVAKSGDKVVSLILANTWRTRVDIYLATPDNFWLTALFRTGSASHNQYLAALALSRGLRLRLDGQGVVDATGARIAWRTEPEIFQALGLDYIPPERRER